MTEHLLNVHGYRDVVFAGGPPGSPYSQARFAGFRQALAAAAGLPRPPRPALRADFSEAGGRRLAAEILAAKELLRAAVAANDQMAVGLVSSLAAAGVGVAGQVAVTGFDGVQLSRFCLPPLTTVHQPMRELGATCISMLLARLGQAAARFVGPAPAAPSRPPRTAVLPTTLVIRKSCGCAAGLPAPWPAGDKR
ncbi:MAG: LacI family DNA-binding transcriptional regulator [Acidimicrobiales bacterium]